MLPDPKYFENSKEFLVIDIVVKLNGVEDIEIKDY